MLPVLHRLSLVALATVAVKMLRNVWCRLSDIAHKQVNGGYSKEYAKAWEQIFSKKPKSKSVLKK